MPLPVTATPITYVDENRTVQENVAVKSRPSGYEPTTEYHPTMRLVRCLECQTVGAAEFVNGFNIRDGDRLMSGKPIIGLCPRCRKETELIPIPTDEKRLKLYYDMQKALDEYVRLGLPVGNGIVWPYARVKKWQEWRENG